MTRRLMKTRQATLYLFAPGPVGLGIGERLRHFPRPPGTPGTVTEWLTVAVDAEGAWGVKVREFDADDRAAAAR